jgi:nitrogen fixation/metabolism regulation signal transduction histidine kinase
MSQAVKKMKLVENIIFIAKLSPSWKNIDEQRQQYYEHALKIIETLDKRKLEAARVLEDQLDTEEVQLHKRVSNLYEQLVQFNKQQTQKIIKHEEGLVKLSGENFVISLLAFILGIIFTTVLTKRIVKPVHQIISGAKDIALGKLDVKVPVFSKDEIGMLATSFNLMAQELKTKELIK